MILPTRLRNALDWRLQNLLTWSAPVRKRTLADGAPPPELTPAAQDRAAALADRYDLRPWSHCCTAGEYQRNLHVLDLLDRLVPRPAPGRCLDIGAGRWDYLPALASFCGPAWDGVELDAHRRDLRFTTRRGHAEFLCRHFPGAAYHAGSVLEHRGPYALVSWLLPFVQLPAFVASRLPLHYFEPRPLLTHACTLLAPGATLLIVNQGEAESEAQGRLLAELPVAATCHGIQPDPFGLHCAPRIAWTVRQAPP